MISQSSTKVNNLSFLKIIFVTSLAMLLVNIDVNAQDKLNVISGWIHFTDASNSLYHHLAGEAYDLSEKRSSKIDGLHSLPDWQGRQSEVRKTLLDIVGPFPGKTPLNARITKTLDEDDYTQENIIYESQPGFYVTSTLFIPHGLKEGNKAPAILYCSGHTTEGYRSPVYQRVILNLVKKGFIVFAFDPVGQGERLEYYDPKTNKSSVGGPTKEHSYPGAQALIAGSSQARYMIWDGIRAVDYLLSRKEVDPSRIGITGRSGGGTQTAYIAAMDDRIMAAAPENYITNFNRLIQSIGPQDAEQNLFNEIQRGIDHADLLEVRAPKPTLMITTTRDMFSIQGARETAKEVARIYNAYEKSANFRMVTDDAPHESTRKNRESMYAFFQKYLNNPGDSTDMEVAILSAKELQVTKTGQVSTSLGGETVFSLNRKTAEGIDYKLEASRKSFPGYLSQMLKSAKRLSGYREPSKAEQPVFTGRFQMEGYVVEKYFVKGEGNYVIPYLLMRPDRPSHKALIYLDPSSKSAKASPGEEMEWFVKRGFTVLAPDLLGIGEMGSGNFHGDAYIGGVSYNEWFLSMLIGRSIVGVQSGDVIRLTHLLGSMTGIEDIYGLARKEMGPVLLHAAAFDKTIKHIALVNSYSSYRSIVMNRSYDPNFIHSTVPGALEAYDLPDLAASLAPRNLLIVDVTDGNGDNSNFKSINEDLSIIKAAYHYKKADGQLNIIFKESKNISGDIYGSWIK